MSTITPYSYTVTRNAEPIYSLGSSTPVAYVQGAPTITTEVFNITGVADTYNGVTYTTSIDGINWTPMDTTGNTISWSPLPSTIGYNMYYRAEHTYKPYKPLPDIRLDFTVFPEATLDYVNYFFTPQAERKPRDYTAGMEI